MLDAPVSLPSSGGPYRIEGFGPDERRLFSLGFAPLIEAETGSGHFVFSLPVDPAWADSLARITLTGPDGRDTLDASTDRPIGIFTERDTGRIRKILRSSSHFLIRKRDWIWRPASDCRNPLRCGEGRPGGAHRRQRIPSSWIPRTKYRWVRRKSRAIGSTATTPAAIWYGQLIS